MFRFFLGLHVAKYTWFSIKGDICDGLLLPSSFLLIPYNSTISEFKSLFVILGSPISDVVFGSLYSNFFVPASKNKRKFDGIICIVVKEVFAERGNDEVCHQNEFSLAEKCLRTPSTEITHIRTYIIKLWTDSPEFVFSRRR